MASDLKVQSDEKSQIKFKYAPKKDTINGNWIRDFFKGKICINYLTWTSLVQEVTRQVYNTGKNVEIFAFSTD